MDGLILLISPFVTLGALAAVFERATPPEGFQLVTNWSQNALLSGASDPEVYPLIQELGGRLYLHDRIHLKLFIASESRAVLSTGNLTAKGLGLAERANIEASSDIWLTPMDWIKIGEILQDCLAVTDTHYQAARDYVVANRKPQAGLPDLVLPSTEGSESPFSYLSLPASSNLESLWRFYQDARDSEARSMLAEEVHDLHLYRITQGLSRDAFFSQLRESFTNHPFIVEFVIWLRSRRSASFGEVKAWIQNSCSDKPTPYRRELTGVTQVLYLWLQAHFEQVKIERPGYSEVIRWSQ